MKPALPLAALAHLLLLALLYLDSRARQVEDGVTRERAARQRYAVLRREAMAERGVEPMDDEPGRADAGVPLPAGNVARARLGRRRGPGAGWARGAAVSRNADERTLLAELRSTRPEPGRVFLGRPAHAAWSFLDSWYTLGPFPVGPAPYPPEARVDLDAEYAGTAGALVRWRFLQSPHPEVVPETMTPYSVHYAYTKLRSDQDREVWLGFGADDSLKAWLNDELVWDCGEHWRPWVLDEGARRVTLRQGYNTLLVRLDNWPDHGAFSVAVRMLP